MSYQVLARKWRPKSFSTLVGQPFVKQALSHALSRQQLHHAYLFAGTRGVGKTTIARIFAKCLNCESMVTAEPCGHCVMCTSIDSGQCVDVIEVDAASRTRVEDTRELLENIQYLPVHGRHKVYIIDEVHMLSGHSFNALLKTLEEPPAHVKFLLATTEPDKLPVTVLSRCLRFDLQPLTSIEIEHHLASILNSENYSFEPGALKEIAKAAKGSVRDSLSLLEQVVAYSDEKMTLAHVQLLLGLGHQQLVIPLLSALLGDNPEVAFEQISLMSEKGVAFEAALDTLLTYLHALAMAKVLPNYPVPDDVEAEQWAFWLSSCTPEALQLLYQIGIQGKQDFVLAPSPRQGYEMLILRMLCFQPVAVKSNQSSQFDNQDKVKKNSTQSKLKSTITSKQMTSEASSPSTQPEVKKERSADLSLKWAQIVEKLPLTGLTQIIAQSSVVQHWDGEHLVLKLEQDKVACLSDSRQTTLQKILSQYLKKNIQLKIETGTVEVETPAVIQKAQSQKKHSNAQRIIENDPAIQNVIHTFDATIEKITPKA